MKKNSSLFIHSPAHSRPCSSHFIPPSHRGGALTRENEGEGKGRLRRRENKVFSTWLTCIEKVEIPAGERKHQGWHLEHTFAHRKKIEGEEEEAAFMAVYDLSVAFERK
ncbi:unnamed protein product [Leuciscus chuanchicus]